ncbi:hypothetical protein KEM56_005741 [Ascosphaera pollenicola]|nr:hypothetical protein KEM56_005741 [Ascosphaera pollenicola]
MEEDTLREHNAPEVATPAVVRSEVSIDWSKYELPPFTEGASDFINTQGTTTAGPSSQAPESSFVHTTPFSQHSQALEEDADDDASLPSVTDLRENRFLGPVKNWRAFTRQERNIWKAFEIERSRDLSAHLFNAFALDRRAVRIGQLQSKDTGKGKAVSSHRSRSPSPTLTEPDEDDEEAVFQPGRHWTAWPMPASTVPREGEDMERNADDRYTITARPDPRPSSNLEECLMSRMLKVARERWNSREWVDEENKKLAQKDPFTQNQHSQGESGVAHNDVYTQVDDSQSVRFDSRVETESGEGLSDGEGLNAGCSQSHTEDLLRPMFQTDDEKSYKILRPAARHILTRVDDLLLALHRARASYMDIESDKEERTDQKQKRKERGKHKSIGRKRVNQGDFKSTEVSVSESQSQDQNISQGLKERDNQSRPRKRRQRSKSAQNKSLAVDGEDLRVISGSEDDFAPTSSSSSESDSELSDSLDPKRMEDVETASDHERTSASEKLAIKYRYDRIGTRDWSDVLGTAALTGFPLDAVERASARCARLFNEDMEFRAFETGRIRKVPSGNRDENGEDGPIFEYTEEPPDVSELGKWKWRRQHMGKRREKHDPRPRQQAKIEEDEARQAAMTLTSVPEVQSFVKKAPEHKLMCPVTGCARSRPGNGFARVWNLNQHISRMHSDMDLNASEGKRRAEDDDAGGRPTRSRSVAPDLVWMQEDSSIMKET